MAYVTGKRIQLTKLRDKTTDWVLKIHLNQLSHASTNNLDGKEIKSEVKKWHKSINDYLQKVLF